MRKIRTSTIVNSCWLPAVLVVLAACGSGEPSASEGRVTHYVFLSDSGKPIVNNAQHACVRDNRSGLTWESKSDQGGLHDWRNTYSWFNPTQAHHEIDYRGTAGAGRCEGSSCDTWNAVAAINDEKACGFGDWRMPSKDELFSISDLLKAKTPPTIDTTFFPLTQPAEYWSANDYSFQPDSAWAWNFQHGHDRVDWKKSPKFVRLVRGDAIDLTKVKE